jgi:large subunit ribosomal protein L1
MPKHGKKFKQAKAGVERKLYELPEAVQKAREVKFAGFDETLEISVKLGVDPKHADQMVRGTVVLPHGTGRDKRVLVIAGGEKLKEAEEAGADFVGGAEMAQKIQEGWLDFDAVIATPDMMREVGKLGRVLGPRGMMPNPKTGTVTFEVAGAVKEIKAGKVEFRVDKTAIIHVPLGKMSFEDSKLVENTETLMSAILRAKPAAAKGKYVETVYLATTMGPGVAVDPELLQKRIG